MYMAANTRGILLCDVHHLWRCTPQSTAPAAPEVLKLVRPPRAGTRRGGRRNNSGAAGRWAVGGGRWTLRREASGHGGTRTWTWTWTWTWAGHATCVDMDRGETLRDMPVTLRDMHMDMHTDMHTRTAGHSPLTDGHHKVLGKAAARRPGGGAPSAR